MGKPTASVIVRARDKAATIEHALQSLRRQSVRPEIIVVDSGSRDGTVRIARPLCDQLIEIAPDEFTYGRALNIGAAAARAPTHFALSAHCFAQRDDWIERSLAHYARPQIAGTCGYSGSPPNGAPPGPVHQDIRLLKQHPFWGFTNHASSWRASVWERFNFDEAILAAEDKEWSWRVLEAGYQIVLDPALDVGAGHRFEQGFRAYYRRHRRDTGAVASFAELPPYGLRDMVAEWWQPEPDEARSLTRLRLSPWRLTGLLARQAGLRQGGRRP